MLRRAFSVFLMALLLVSTIPAGSAVAEEEVPFTPQGELATYSSSVARLQQALKDKKFYRGSIDGIYGAQTQQAVMAFRKEIGASRSFSWSDSHWDELEIYQAPYTRFDEPDRVEVNLSKQTAHLYRGGNLVATFPISSGNGELYHDNAGNLKRAVTPTGDFEVYRHVSGWYESTLGLGLMLSPWFFNGGIALHGSLSVPSGPASHGCIRLTTWDSGYLDRYTFRGMPVHVYYADESPVYGSDGPFADVPAGHTFVAGIQWMVDTGITEGCRPYFFCPDAPASRGQIAAFMRRALQPYLGEWTARGVRRHRRPSIRGGCRVDGGLGDNQRVQPARQHSVLPRPVRDTRRDGRDVHACGRRGVGRELGQRQSRPLPRHTGSQLPEGGRLDGGSRGQPRVQPADE